MAVQYMKPVFDMLSLRQNQTKKDNVVLACSKNCLQEERIYTFCKIWVYLEILFYFDCACWRQR